MTCLTAAGYASTVHEYVLPHFGDRHIWRDAVRRIKAGGIVSLSVIGLSATGNSMMLLMSSSRNFDLNGEARMARAKQNISIIPPA